MGHQLAQVSHPPRTPPVFLAGSRFALNSALRLRIRFVSGDRSSAASSVGGSIAPLLLSRLGVTQSLLRWEKVSSEARRMRRSLRISFAGGSDAPSFILLLKVAQSLPLGEGGERSESDEGCSAQKMSHHTAAHVFIYALSVIPSSLSSRVRIFFEVLSASSSVSVRSGARRMTLNATLFLPSPSCLPR